ncbi:MULTISPECIES: hypothetical protein [unclassified Luteococcus]|uniref:hypothetical protein n=1 Tax=unclassified Luteococcus TaxID=2639923 RepID=UPI00313DEFC3
MSNPLPQLDQTIRRLHQLSEPPFDWRVASVKQLAKRVGASPLGRLRVKGVEFPDGERFAFKAEDGTVQGFGTLITDADLDQAFAAADAAATEQFGNPVGTVRYVPCNCRRVWRMPTGHDFELVQSLGSLSLSVVAENFRHQQTAPPTSEQITDGCIEIIDTVTIALRELLASEPETWRLCRLLNAVEPVCLVPEMPVLVEFDRREAPFVVSAIRSDLSDARFEMLSLNPFIAEDWPERDLDSLFDELVCVLEETYGECLDDHGDERVWLINDWTVHMFLEDEWVRMRLEPPSQQPAEQVSDELFTQPAEATPEVQAAVETASRILDGEYDFTVENIDALARLLRMPTDSQIDPMDRNEGNDVVLPNPLGAFQWALEGNADDESRFNHLRVAFDPGQTGPEDFERVKGWFEQAWTPAHEEEDGWAAWYHSHGTAELKAMEDYLLFTIAPD